MDRETRIGLCAAMACVIEAAAPKPGNVHPGQDFPNLKFLDFLGSAHAISKTMGRASGQPVGATILAAIQATQQVAKTNTNLGIVLLLAPLSAVGDDDQLRSGVENILAGLTVDDAVLTYEAIRLAKPGGLGTVADQDFQNQPTVTLREAMQMAADRDLIANQYGNGFADVFAGTHWLKHQIDAFLSAEDLRSRQYPPPKILPLVVDLYFWFLARHPDSLIARKRGMAEAVELQRRAQALANSSKEQRESHIAELHDWFAAAFPHRNPGTTADLVCASLFIALRTGIIPLPDIPETDLKWP